MVKRVVNILMFFIGIILTYIIQIYVLNSLNFFGVRANLILAEIVIVAMLIDKKKSIIFAVVMGIISDLIFQMSLGYDLIMYLIISMVVHRISDKYRKDNKAAIIYMTFVSVGIFEIMELISYMIENKEIVNIFAFLKQTIILCLLSVGISYVLYRIIDKVHLKNDKVEVRIARL